MIWSSVGVAAQETLRRTTRPDESCPRGRIEQVNGNIAASAMQTKMAMRPITVNHRSVPLKISNSRYRFIDAAFPGI
jgi:hypothetical protein